MADLTGRLVNASFSWSGKPLITIEFNERESAVQMFDELKSSEKVSVGIKKFRQKRSLDANAYAWVLIGKIAEKTNVPRVDVYRSAIKEIGGNYDVVCAQDKAVEALRESWSKNGIGWITDTMPSKIEGCTNVMVYYGSSSYDSQQMCRLINILVQDCEQLGIEVKPQEEINSLLSSWKG